MKERSAEYQHVTDLVAEQRAFWQKKNIYRHGDWAWPLPQFSSQTGVSKTRGRGRGLSFFFLENAVLGLGLWLWLGLGLGLGLVSTLTITLKQHSLKKDRPQSLVLLTPFANRFMDFYLSVH